MSNKRALISRLDNAISKAATDAILQALPIVDSKSGIIYVGNTVIEKNNRGFYNISSLNRDLLYENIVILDIAIIISQKYTLGETSKLRRVVDLEYEYAKHHSEMIHYIHCMKSAKKKKDYTVLFVLEDKFQLAEMYAKKARDSIAFFKKTK